LRRTGLRVELPQDLLDLGVFLLDGYQSRLDLLQTLIFVGEVSGASFIALLAVVLDLLARVL